MDWILQDDVLLGARHLCYVLQRQVTIQVILNVQLHPKELLGMVGLDG